MQGGLGDNNSEGILRDIYIEHKEGAVVPFRAVKQQL
jgi:hypothetical protein